MLLLISLPFLDLRLKAFETLEHEVRAIDRDVIIIVKVDRPQV